MYKKWSYSLFTLVLYLSTFHLWNLFPKHIYLIGYLSLLLYLVGFILAYKNSYFIDRVDRNIHLIILIDIFLETNLSSIQKILEFFGVLNKGSVFNFHGDFDFYYCAIVMGFVIWLYRFKRLKE